MTIDQTRTKDAYGLQWNRFRILRPEDRATFRSRTGCTAEDLDGKLVLDGGAGWSRYLRVAAELGPAALVGMDLNRAVVAARELTSGLPAASRSSGRPPPAPTSPAADSISIYSIGVLDHTPDPKAAFLELASLLRKPGGGWSGSTAGSGRSSRR
ncbi:MAG: class I SAM-dependent methyltransferase [Isosphaeraceae bacterium]